MMTVLTSFEDRKKEKQLAYERKLLRDLPVQELKKSVMLHFNQIRKQIGPMDEDVEEVCFDVAVEAFLIGGEYSRFSMHGETIHMAKKRCTQSIDEFIDTLFHFWLYWNLDKERIREDSIYSSCEKFVDYWWKKGFLKGERRYKLRLH
ncbi:DUF2521 family protein [Lederbergia graminis]|uniref:DUF2521 family protein n=1 Tax=Lederbergia graminis TaxID=735518 RepID=A0ABW0LJG9_9BACI